MTEQGTSIQTRSPRAPGCAKGFLVGLAVLLAVVAVLAVLRMGSVVVVTEDDGYVQTADGAPIEFSVVSYNVQARPWFDDAKYKFTHMSPLLNPHDLVGIQECFKSYRRLWDGTTHPVKIYHGTLKAPWKICGSGLSVLARFPLLELDTEHFDTAGDTQNMPASKGMVFARFDVAGVPIDFYTTHMEAGRKPRAMWSRREQGEQLVRFVRRHSPAEHAVIFAGDFNMRPTRGDDAPLENYTPGAAELDFAAMTREQIFAAILLELGLTDAGVQLHGTAYSGVDHVLYRSGIEATLTPLSWQDDDEAFYRDGKPLSDHEPMIVRFRIKPLVDR